MGYEIALHAPQDYRRSVFRVYATSVTDSFPVLLIFKIRSQGIEALTEILEIPWTAAAAAAATTTTAATARLKTTIDLFAYFARGVDGVTSFSASVGHVNVFGFLSFGRHIVCCCRV
jgi:hypothetical protein